MFNEERHFESPIRWAMIGGGRGSQIGYIHRTSAARDRMFTLVAGAFDINEERCREFGANLGLDAERCYSDYKIMFAEEAKREDGIQAVSIATPNKFHFEMCKAALEAKLHVICEKPLCFTSEEAAVLKNLADKNNLIVGITYGYSGHQLVHQAREMVQRGDLGEIRIINVQFAHGWHSEEVEANDPGTKWRVTPEVAGPAYVLGDVGTHCLNLAEVIVPDMKIRELMCSRQSFIKSRAPLEDNAQVMMHLEGGGIANLWASCVNAGAMHEFKIRVVGSKASIEWCDEHPNQLKYEIQGQPKQILDRGHGYLYRENPAIDADRLGGGHAVGLFESWSNLYHRFGRVMNAKLTSDEGDVKDMWFPGIEYGTEGVKFIEKCIESADNGAGWVKY